MFRISGDSWCQNSSFCPQICPHTRNENAKSLFRTSLILKSSHICTYSSQLTQSFLKRNSDYPPPPKTSHHQIYWVPSIGYNSLRTEIERRLVARIVFFPSTQFSNSKSDIPIRSNTHFTNFTLYSLPFPFPELRLQPPTFRLYLEVLEHGKLTNMPAALEEKSPIPRRILARWFSPTL